MGFAIVLAPARLSDAPRIARMSRELVEVGLAWRWRTQLVARQILRSDSEVLVGRQREKIVGFAIMRFLMEEAHLLLLAVDPAARRTGLGRELLSWLEESARTAGVFSVQVEVREKNRDARRFYARLGYREVSHLPGYYQGRESAIRMASDLRVRV